MQSVQELKCAHVPAREEPVSWALVPNRRGYPKSQVSPRVRWKYADIAKEFHRRHGHARYAMDFISALEAEMRDTELSKEHRVLAAIKRYAWGNLSDVAVTCMQKVAPEDPEPRPLTQADFARILHMSAATVSEACTSLRDRFYLRPSIRELYPEDHQGGKSSRPASQPRSSESVDVTLESDSNSSNSTSLFVRFRHVIRFVNCQFNI
jgi:hypothetical protein